jgi:hypothetical protein
MPDIGPLSSALEEIRERSERPLGPTAMALPISSPAVQGLLESAADVPRLLAALDAVLKPHQPGRFVISGALCVRHENHRYFSITQPEADEVIACEACPAAVYISCDGCGPDVPFTSCRTRRRITRALLGEEAPDEH